MQTSSSELVQLLKKITKDSSVSLPASLHLTCDFPPCGDNLVILTLDGLQFKRIANDLVIFKK